MHHFANREWRRLTLDQPVAAGGGNQVGDGGTQPERGAVNQTELPLSDRIRGASLRMPQRVDQEEDRSERRANVVRDRDDSVRAISAREPREELAAIGVTPRLFGFVEL